MEEFLKLKGLVEKGLIERYGVLTDEIMRRRDFELAEIEGNDLSKIFLIAADTASYAENRGMLIGPGRGAAASSIVCYALGITKLDPIKYGLLSECFFDSKIYIDFDVNPGELLQNKALLKLFISEKYGNIPFIRILSLDALEDIRDYALAEGIELTKIYNNAFDDSKVYDCIIDRNAIDLFIFTAKKAKAYLKESNEKSVEALAKAIARLRPNGTRILEYDEEQLIFQEQITLLLSKIGGVSLEKAEKIRRFILKDHNINKDERKRIINNSAACGLSESLSNRLIENIVAYAPNAFCKAHAVSYAVIAYLHANARLARFSTCKTTSETLKKRCLNVRVLRGENELTGNLIEIYNKGVNVLVECGKSLANTSDKIEPVENEVLNRYYDAVIVSHNHADHNGLVDKVDKGTPVYMGEKTLGLYRVINPDTDTVNFRTYVDGAPFFIGKDGKQIKVTPYLCDHSCPDSYMLLFEYNGESVLYSGDFRSHGRKNYDELLSRLPDRVDTLIVEGTNSGSEETAKEIISEVYVQNKITKVMKDSNKPVFVLVAGTNIDRIVGIYKASIKTKRDMFVTSLQARILESVGGSVPRPTVFENVKVYYPKSVTEQDLTHFIDLRKKSVGIADVAKIEKFTMLIHTSALPYLKKLDAYREVGLSGATIIYSMWEGYKKTENMKRFLTETAGLGIRTVSIHTSGHADAEAISRLTDKVNPMGIITVHTGKNRQN